jgi:hypothetical protein
VYFEQSKPLNQPNRGGHGQNNGFEDLRMDCRQTLLYGIMEGLRVTRPERRNSHCNSVMKYKATSQE